MKAQMVLRRYAAGARDFRGVNLRGANFRERDLSGADFSGADLRSASFTNATLRNVSFAGAQAGAQKRWIVAQLVLATIVSFISGILQAFAGAFTAVFLNSANFSDSLEQAIGLGTYLLLIVAVYVAIALQGFSVSVLGSLLCAFAVAFIAAAVAAVVDAAAVAVVGAFAGAFAGAVTSAGAIAFTLVSTLSISGVAAAVVASIVAIASTIAVTVALSGAAAIAATVATVGLLFSAFISWRVIQEDDKFSPIRTVRIALSAIGGTSFAGADLTYATFSKAQIKQTNFANSSQQQTCLTSVNWQQAKQLNQARLSASILQDRRVRQLLDGSNSGYKQDFSDADLRGANLSGLTLENANLTRATLSGARLHKTLLEGAILTEAQAIGADFTGAYLTAAKLENWNIDSTTTLANIDCRYVFLLEQPNQNGDQERRPHDPKKDFQSGDFETFFKEVLDEVQILIRDGIHPAAFRAALRSLTQQNPAITPDAIKAYEKQGHNVMLTLQVPEGTNKADVERAWDIGYRAGLQAGRDAERLDSIDFLKQTLLLSAGKHISIKSESKSMTGNDQSQNIDVKGDFTVTANSSVISLRDISGKVNNQIAQLDSDPVQAQLKDLLTQLTTVIETEPNLDEEQKTEALEEVKQLAAAGQAPQDGPMKKAAKRAITVLKGMTIGLGETTKFVEACNGLLPTIGALFGL